jgi:PAS domain S-box-containing protein
MRFGILKKFLAAFLVLSLVPLLVLSYYAREKVTEVGRRAVDGSRQALSHTAMRLLEARARAIARQVELFLDGAAGDLKSLAMLPPDPNSYLKFHRIHQSAVWVRTGSPDHPREIRPAIPLYRELTYADADGIEGIRVAEGRLHAEGRDVSGPFRSDFGPEDYFARARALAPGAFYVSRLVGRHVRAEEQLQGAAGVESAIGGDEYQGILRFAMAVYRKGRFAGVVSLALDHRHLMEYTQHVLPIGSAEVVFPSYASGNYAFLFDDEGWIITHPKFWDIRGWDRDTGEVIDPLSPLYNEGRLKDGTAPFNLLHVPFIHTNYRFIALEVLDDRSGVTRTSSVGGVARVMAFAPIHFPHGEYANRGIFGGVTLGAQTEAFHQAVDKTAAAIEADLAQTVRRFWMIIIGAGCVVTVIAVLLARSFTRPIRLLARKVEQINQGRYDFAVNIRSGDELENLGQNFQQMGHQLEKHRYNLMASLSELRASKEEIEASNRRLEAQVEMLKTLHGMGRELSVSFDREKILHTVLSACVQGLGFERAVVYLFDEVQRRLVCAKVLGFDGEVARLAREASYHVDRHDCFPVRVFHSGEPTMVRDVASDPALTDLDRRMAAESGTGSFSFAPIRVADRSVGVLGADYGTSARRISEEAMESLKIVANDAALALERARLMEAAVKERDFIESIFANMLSGVLVVDADGRVQSVNLKAEQVLDRAADELVGRPVDEALAPYPALLEQFRKVSAGEELLPPVLDIQTPAGRQIYLETSFSCIHRTASGTGNSATLLIFRDVTQRKKIEDHLRRSDRLVSLGTLAAGIAHEIRNPLTGISLLLDDLHDRMANRTDERLLMQSALEEIEKLEKIITELLEFAANPSSRLVTRDLNKVIDHTLFFVHKQMRRQKIELQRDTPDNLPPIRLDPEKMKQAVLNILLNAIRMLPDGGTIRITTRLHENLETLDGCRAVELCISDDGPGVHPDDIEYLFDPFFTRNPDGFGLGLAITHTIVEEHRGRITVENRPGGGACFRIYLPVEAEGVGNGTHSGR